MALRRKYALPLVLLVLLTAGLSARLARRQTPPDFGRLTTKTLPRNDDIRPQPLPMIATPVTEQASADPMLVAPAAREQEFLSVTPAAAPPARGHSAVNIVGDSSGIAITRSADAPKRPVLAGGIFKQQ